MDVETVIAKIDALNGKTITVGGYLGKCAGYDCLLFANRDGERVFSQQIAALRKAAAQGKKARWVDDPPFLGIGYDVDFDRKAAPLTHGYVMITGKVTNECRYHGKNGCTDRATDIVPTNIILWQPSAKAGIGSPTT